MNLKKIIFFILTLILTVIIYIKFFAYNGFYDKIQNEIENKTNKEYNTIDLKDIFKFKWDRFYIIHENVRQDKFEEIVGDINLEKNEFKEFHEKIIFLKKNKIVYFENYEINISEPSYKIVYLQNNFENYHFTDSNSTKYYFSEHNNKNNKYFTLKLIE